MGRRKRAVFGGVLLFLLGAQPLPLLAQGSKKFEALYRSGKTVAGALDAGVTYQRFRELLQALTTEVSIAEDVATVPSEKLLVRIYAAALQTLKDSATLWQAKIAGDDGAAIAALRQAYGHAPSGSADKALETVWAVAADRLAAGARGYVGDLEGAGKLLEESRRQVEDAKFREQARARRALSPEGLLERFQFEMDSPQYFDRAVAIDGITIMDAETAKKTIPRLMLALSDEHPNVRRAAAIALGGFGAAAENAIPLLEEAFAKKPPPGENSDSRYAARDALDKIKAALGKK